MQSLYDAINDICSQIQVISDWFWNFPTNLDWYASIPILGNFSLAVLLLVGSGIYFSCRLRFVQVRRFKYGLQTLIHSKSSSTGISCLAAFLLSTAMRVGPGNILGVTGAISVGGPGTLFWMWVSAFFGMATSFVESTLSQIFKEQKGDEYVGGMPFYGRALLKGAAWVGIALSVLYIVYAFLCFPAQGFNTISAAGSIASVISGTTIATNSGVYWTAFAVLMIVCVLVSFGGLRKLTKVTDVLVPIMAAIYIITVLVLIFSNLQSVPYFFQAVFTQAFQPEAIFGGAFGIAISQGIRRGLMSNEAGQGTISMPAAAADAPHPCDQGCVQTIGVFLDTIVICTLTGFIVVMGHMWTGGDPAGWMNLGKLDQYLTSAAALSGDGWWNTTVNILVSLCFGLFAFTTLVGFISFTEMCAKRISDKPVFINTIRVLCLLMIAFGIITSISGMDLSALWNLSDFANILMVYCNIPLLYLGMKYVLKAWKHFENNDGTPFTSEVAGISVPVWDAKAAQEEAAAK